MINVAIVANAPLAGAMAAVCRRTLGESGAKRLFSLDVDFDARPDDARQQVENFLQECCAERETLVLTGLFGATPDNLARAFALGNARVRVISGVNLGMALRACNYAAKPLDEVAAIATEGGRRAVNPADD